MHHNPSRRCARVACKNSEAISKRTASDASKVHKVRQVESLRDNQKSSEGKMAYRNKTFVSFDGDNDIHYYWLMRAWKQNDHSNFNFFDAHDINTALDTSQELTIKRRLRERLNNAKVVVSLIGESTRYLYKFVRWELEQALSMDLPIIGVNLNQKRCQDIERCPPVLRNELVVHVSFQAAILQHALENWPRQFVDIRNRRQIGPYYYSDETYRNLGL